MEAAKQRLEELRDTINLHHPANNEISKFIKKLTPSEDTNEVKYYRRMKKGIKEKFALGQDKVFIELEKEGPRGSGTIVGQRWHEILKKEIDNPSPDKNEAAKAVITSLKSAKETSGLEFLQTKFPLYGFMKDKESLESYFWHGQVDAIGWFQDRYVIVEWKTGALLNFWEKDPLAYGDYLHQCLVYRRLLQLHLKDLENPPYILLVPIDNFTGKQIYPALFREFPKECTDHFAVYDWSLDKPEDKIPVKKDMIKVTKLPLDLRDVKVKDLFKDETTVRQLLDVLGLKLYGLKIED